MHTYYVFIPCCPTLVSIHHYAWLPIPVGFAGYKQIWYSSKVSEHLPTYRATDLVASAR